MSFIGATSSASTRGAGVRQQGHLAGVLDRRGDIPLMLRAVAGHPPGSDLAAVGDELPQQAGVLVVNVGDLLLAEQAHLLLWFACRCFGHRGAPWGEPRLNGDGQIWKVS